MKKDSHRSSQYQEENILGSQRKVRMKAQDLATLAARKKFLSYAEEKLFSAQYFIPSQITN